MLGMGTGSAAPNPDVNKNVQTGTFVCAGHVIEVVTIEQSHGVALPLADGTGTLILRAITFHYPDADQTSIFTSGKGVTERAITCEGFSPTRGVPFTALVTLTP
jgi:hypothetical protein